jgi:DNA-binding MarR family transcriptional regulator
MRLHGVLAQRAGVRRQTMSQIVDELVRADYVERREDPNDRCSRIAVLTRRA